jgi:hypothetical protein
VLFDIHFLSYFSISYIGRKDTNKIENWQLKIDN